MDERLLERTLRRFVRSGRIQAWRAVERQVDSRELFLVGTRTEMRRAKAVTRTLLTVYRDFRRGSQDFRGSAVLRLHPVQRRRELEQALGWAAEAALQAENAPYPLVAPGGPDPVVPPEALACPETGGADLERALPALEAVLQRPLCAGVRLTAAELFLERVAARIRNSAGLDVRWTAVRGSGEVILEAEAEGGAVELYRELSFTRPRPEYLEGELQRLGALCRDRAAALPTPALGSAPLLLTGEAVRELAAHFVHHAAAETAHRRLSRFRPGEPVGGVLDLSLEPFLPHSPGSAPWDEDGWPLAPVRLIEGGRLLRCWGPVQYCHYLGLEPTGGVPNVRLHPGSRPLEALRGPGVLEAAVFSDFQCEPLTGNFAGELRLAYWHSPDGSRRPVTGGSVSGCLVELAGGLQLSQQVQTLAGFEGPMGVLLPAASVTGG